MPEQEISISTGAVYRVSDHGIIPRIETTLNIIDGLAQLYSNPIGIELMLIDHLDAEIIYQSLTTSDHLRGNLDNIKESGANITIHADRPVFGFDFPPKIDNRHMYAIHTLLEVVGAKHVVWHSSWGNLPLASDYGFHLAIENDDLHSGGARLTPEIEQLAKNHDRLVLDIGHIGGIYKKTSALELDRIIKCTSERIVEYHISAIEEGSHHIPIQESQDIFYKEMLSIIPPHSLCVIESPVSGDPIVNMAREIRLITECD